MHGEWVEIGNEIVGSVIVDKETKKTGAGEGTTIEVRSTGWINVCSDWCKADKWIVGRKNILGGTGSFCKTRNWRRL